MNDRSRTRFAWIVTTVFLLVVAVGLQFFTDFYHHEDSDSIIYSIMSYTHVTLFDWGQDRLLSFAPFIVGFIKNPSANLVALTTIFLAMAFSTPFLVGKILDLRSPVLFGFAAIAFLFPFDGYFWFEQCVVPYSESFFLVCVSLLATRKSLSADRRTTAAAYAAVAAFFLVVAYEVAQPGLAIYAVWACYLLLSTIRAHVDGDEAILKLDRFRIASRRFRDIILLTLCAFCIFSLIQYRTNQSKDILNTPMELTMQMSMVARGILTSSLHVVHFYVASRVGLALTFWGTVAMVAYLAYKRQYVVLRNAALLFALPAAAIAVTLCSLIFVVTNQFHQRYLCDPIFLLAFGAAYLLVSILDRFPVVIRREPALTALLALLAVVDVYADFHVTRFETPAERIAEIVPASAEMRLIDDADGITGNYWRIWPAVWLENAWGRSRFVGVAQRTGYNYPRLLDPAQEARGLTLIAYNDDKSAQLCLRICLELVSAPRRNYGSLVIITTGPYTYQPAELQLRLEERGG